MPTLPRSSRFTIGRKSNEAIALAALSITAVGCLRYPVEPPLMFAAEMIAIVVLAAGTIAKFFNSRYVSAALTLTPAIAAVVARIIGSPIAIEMTALSTLGAAALAMATGTDRTRAMSLVSSGFLTLFAVAISDSSYAVVLAIAWMAVCVWHLVENHWERLELCAVQQVRRGASVRPLSVVVAIVICIASGLIVRGRFGESKRFTIGFMPTSGGSQWSDPAARSGVGTGDAAIAAKDHAESFGAVESELFLESTESTLFDMFNDSIGEPKKKNKWERRQGLRSHKVLEAHQKTAKSEKGGNSFSTDRLPPKQHLHLNDSKENAVVQWAGPTGIRLAMNRYDAFDGVDWSNSATHRDEKLIRQEFGGAAWFFDPTMLTSGRKSTGVATSVNQLKVLRLDSTRIPTPMMTSGLHIKDIDRQDFFGIEDDGSYFMPGRDKVPPLTVVNIAHVNVMEDVLLSSLAQLVLPASKNVMTADASGLKTCVASWTHGCQHTYEKLQAIVSRLRSEFTFDRSVDATADVPVAAFLQTRRGGDHLFATTAALMARELGLQSRLVTGFYVRPSSVDIAAGHTNVLPDDVHVWAEIQLSDGRWFEIEPTPGYRQPIYTPSTWLVVKRFAAAHWIHAIGILTIGLLLFLTRIFWIELGLKCLFPISAMLWPRRRMELAMHVIQTRAKLAGCPRVAGRPQRDWLLALTATHGTVRESVRQFCDAADRAAFADSKRMSIENTFEKELLMHLTIKTLRRAYEETHT